MPSWISGQVSVLNRPVKSCKKSDTDPERLHLFEQKSFDGKRPGSFRACRPLSPQISHHELNLIVRKLPPVLLVRLRDLADRMSDTQQTEIFTLPIESVRPDVGPPMTVPPILSVRFLKFKTMAMVLFYLSPLITRL
jgi:hypothetical protein